MLPRYCALLAEVIVDARAKAHYTEPELAALLSTIEPLPEVLLSGSEDPQEVMDLLLAYEARHLGGVPKYTTILREGPREDGQLRFGW
jgi:hypothetical protein